MRTQDEGPQDPGLREHRTPGLGIQDPGPWTPELRIQNLRTRDLRLQDHSLGYRTWDPWSDSECAISIIVIYS